MFWQIVSWTTLAGEVAVLVLAIRLYRANRTPAFALLMWACICFVIARSSWFIFGFLHGLLFPHSDRAARATAYRWHEYTDYTFQLFFVAVMILTLISFLRQRGGGATFPRLTSR
jgi:uncharacterized protein with PQ loop repeat